MEMHYLVALLNKLNLNNKGSEVITEHEKTCEEIKVAFYIVVQYQHKYVHTYHRFASQ